MTSTPTEHAQPFEPKFMKVGVLTAALQELTPREVRDPDPDRAIEEWLGVRARARRRLHPAVGGAAPDARPTCRRRRCSTRSPTRSTCASRSTRTRAKRVAGGARRRPASASPTSATSTTCCTTIAAIRKKKHDFMLRVFDAAVLLGVDAVCGFVGRNQQHSMDENLVDFEQQFVPLLKEAKERGLTYRVEQCPMPGWTTGDNWHNNIAYTPGAWIALHRICEKHGVGDQFRIHYDPSHAILMGQDTRSIFQYLKDERLRLPDRRLPRQGPGHRREGRVGVGLRRPDDGARRLDRRQAVAEPGRSAERLEEADRARRARAARHGAPRSARLPAEPHASTGSITSSRRASCCSSTSPTRTSSSSTSIRRRASRTRRG